MAKSGIRDIDQMDGFQFEVYLKALFKKMGYKCNVTSNSYDFGADLVLTKDKEKIVVQAKRYGYKNKVGIDAVQQVYAAKAYYKAHSCWVFTNSIFTNHARKLAAACRVELYDREKLMDFINQINPDMTAREVLHSVPAAERYCPSCNGTLIQRTSRNGNVFMGCSNFPECRYTERINQK